MARLGFIGVGVITDAVVQGLHAAGNAGHEIHLSPRSEARSRALAARYKHVIREDSNAAVAAKSDIVFLAVRPQQIPDLVGLQFRAEQTVVSFLAGTPIDQLGPFVAPAARLVRVAPLPCISLGQGPILMTPSDPTVAALFNELGDLIVLSDEANLAAAASITGLMSSHFELQNVAIDWMRTQKVRAPARADRAARRAIAEASAESPASRQPRRAQAEAVRPPRRTAAPRRCARLTLDHLFTARGEGLHQIERGRIGPVQIFEGDCCGL
jgi:pyrroline-5-carboxylate reductase